MSMPARRSALGLLVAGTIAFSLSGCFGGTVITDDTEPTTAPSATSDSETAPVETTLVEGETLTTATFENGMQVDVVLLGYGTTTEDSNWQNEDGTNAFPAGSKEAAIAYVITNTSDEPQDVYGFSETGHFEGTDTYAVTNSSTDNATHRTLGYVDAPYEIYGFDAEEWPLEPGDSVYYADTLYIDGTGVYITTFRINNGADNDSIAIDDVTYTLEP